MKKDDRLLLNCVKFCNSEGIFQTTVKSTLFVCINERFVAFHFGTENKRDDKKLEKNGGRIFRPPTLEKFVEIIRSIQEDG